MDNAPAPWGDYGRILVSGMLERGDDGSAGSILRTGPFVPPATLVGGTLVVTGDARSALLAAGLRGIGFAELHKERIVKLDWRAWDLDAEDPERYPAGYEPENYVLGRKHNPALADAMGPLSEVLIPQESPKSTTADLIRDAPNPFRLPLATDRARSVLEAVAGEWLVSTPLT